MSTKKEPDRSDAESSQGSGFDRREFLGGVGGATVAALAGGSMLAQPSTASAATAYRDWGPRVDLTGLREIFAPMEVESFVVPPGGIDNLGLHSTDIFRIPGKGEFAVDFRGYFRVARSYPTTRDWTTFNVTVNIVDLRLQGSNPDIGRINVRLNPDILSTGQIFPAREVGQDAACRIATGAIFELEQLGLSVFNKEPILLMNEHVRSIPPVNDPSGHALLYNLPLFDLKNPDGHAVAYLTSLRYGADHYLTEAEVRAIRGA